jgi:putative ABC transport system permease protein
VLVSEALPTQTPEAGDHISILMNGKREQLRSLACLSPVYLNLDRAALPDNRTYGIFWMPHRRQAFDLDERSILSLTLSGGVERAVIAELDRLLQPTVPGARAVAIIPLIFAFKWDRVCRRVDWISGGVLA